jgi:hypothetical protein
MCKRQNQLSTPTCDGVQLYDLPSTDRRLFLANRYGATTPNPEFLNVLTFRGGLRDTFPQPQREEDTGSETPSPILALFHF